MLSDLGEDFRRASLPEKDQEMLAYALKLTLTPGRITRADAERLREVGFDDLAIHDICAVTAYFAFANRIADGLGIELEDAPPESTA